MPDWINDTLLGDMLPCAYLEVVVTANLLVELNHLFELINLFRADVVTVILNGDHLLLVFFDQFVGINLLTHVTVLSKKFQGDEAHFTGYLLESPVHTPDIYPKNVVNGLHILAVDQPANSCCDGEHDGDDNTDFEDLLSAHDAVYPFLAVLMFVSRLLGYFFLLLCRLLLFLFFHIILVFL